MWGGGLMQLVIYGAQDVYPSHDEIDEINEIYRPATHVAGNRINEIKINALSKPVSKLDDSNQCCVSYNIIKEEELYVECPQCTKIMNFEVASKWFEIKKSCPMCRFK